MARQKISEIQSLPFYQIIGAPLLALVQGQAQAAQATAEFIERVGFWPPDETAGPDTIGDLKMASFFYDKPGIEGDIQTYRAEVPVLSLVPIPSIEIKEADLDFYVKITDIQTETIHTTVSEKEPDTSEWLQQKRVGFRAAMGKMETTAAGERRMDLQMRVTIKVGQSDIPVGLDHLFRIMDQSISGGPYQPPPPKTEEESAEAEVPEVVPEGEGETVAGKESEAEPEGKAEEEPPESPEDETGTEEEPTASET